MGAPAATAAPDVVAYEGTEVEAADNIQDAPSVGSGVYVVDAPAVDGHAYVEVPRTMPGSTIWVGATVDLGDAATAPDFDGSLIVDGLGDGVGSASCWFPGTVSTNTGDGTETPRLETTLWQTNRDPDCRTAKSVTLVLHPYQWSPPEGTQVQLTVWEEPRATGASGLQTPSRTVTWGDLGTAAEPRVVEAGDSWSDATEISGGSFAFHLEPGSVGVFRMPLALGQHGQALISSQDTVGSDGEVTAFWASPQGGALVRPELQGAPAGTFGLDLRDGPAEQAFATPVVNWRNRELRDGFGSPEQSGIPGTHYFVVSLGVQDIPADGLDFTLQSGFFSDYAVGSPAYEREPGPLAQVASFEEDVRAADPERREPGSDAVPWPIVLMLLGGAAIFGALGVVALDRSRRSRR